jgi:thioredoxin-like negative regulator of GroEL
MFGVIKSAGKILGFKKKEVPKKAEKQSKLKYLEGKFNQAADFFGTLPEKIMGEYEMIRKKSQNLSKTNYDLGMRHLQNGNVKEAIFRFKIIKKFWPENYQARLQLITCLLMDNQKHEAKQIAQEFIKEKPEFKQKLQEIFAQNKRPKKDQISQ